MPLQTHMFTPPARPGRAAGEAQPGPAKARRWGQAGDTAALRQGAPDTPTRTHGAVGRV